MVTETRKAVIKALLKLDKQETAEGEFWTFDLPQKEKARYQFSTFSLESLNQVSVSI